MNDTTFHIRIDLKSPATLNGKSVNYLETTSSEDLFQKQLTDSATTGIFSMTTPEGIVYIVYTSNISLLTATPSGQT